MKDENQLVIQQFFFNVLKSNRQKRSHSKDLVKTVIIKLPKILYNLLSECKFAKHRTLSQLESETRMIDIIKIRFKMCTHKKKFQTGIFYVSKRNIARYCN